MDASREEEIVARLSRIENAVAALQRSVDELISQRRGASAPGPAATSYAPPPPPPSRAYSSRTSDTAGRDAPPPRATDSDDFGAISAWLSSRSPEWWLSRLGVGFVVIAILFLYSYGVDQGWITPLVRVLLGAIVGTALFWGATRTPDDTKTRAGFGMRAIFYGGALATWYVTAYAASVWYGLISITAARLLYLILALVSSWIALQERREIFAFIAVATGFATPFILPAPVTSYGPFALYLGVVGAIGLFIYLIRGWQTTIWTTFLAFWMILSETLSTSGTVPSARGSISLSVLLVLAGVAFTRAASLRRQLLAIGSPRYTAAPGGEITDRAMEAMDAFSKILGGAKSSADSLVFWVMTLLSPIIAVSLLAGIWTSIPTEVSGLILFGLGSAALSFGMSKFTDREFRQVVFTAAALWTLLGIIKIAPDPERLALSAVHAALVLAYVRNALIGPRAIAKVTIVVVLAALVGSEFGSVRVGLLRWRWVASDLVTIAASALISQKLMADRAERIQGVVLIVLTYLTSLVVIFAVLQPIWAPLVTTTYALLGAGLLIMSRRRGGESLLLQLGGVTMVIVVARLLLVDLASVETIWRVFLFLLIGGVFLYAGYKLQPSRS